MKSNTLMALAAATALAITAAVALDHRQRAASPADEAGGPLFPGLAAAVNDAARVEATGPKGPATLIRDADGRWTVAERDGYPASRDAVKNLVVGLAATTLTEPRTAAPELYPRIGVEDPDGPAANSVRIALRRADGGELAAVIVGKTANASSIGRGPGQFYLRRAGEAQSWLASSPMDPPRADPVHWLDRNLPRMPRDRLATVTLRDAAGATLTLRRGDGEAAKNFVVDGLPAGAKPDDMAVEETVGSLAFLSFEDVVRADPAWFANAPVYVFTDRDGATVTLRAARRDGAAWLNLSAAGFPADGPAVSPQWAYRVYDGAGETFLRPPAGFVLRDGE